MKKILIIGVKGMAGHLLFNYFLQKGKFEVYGIARNVPSQDRIFDLDVSNIESLLKILNDREYDYVINCIGILNKDAEDNPDKAIWFNSYFPHLLENSLKEKHTKLIHISTDCVFSGKKGGYTENDVKDGIGFYAQSKALGEVINNKDITIRTSIIGPELNVGGIGLFHWFMSQDVNNPLKGYTEAYWSGITTLELAKVIEKMMESSISGLIQVPSPEKINKYELLKVFNEIYKNGNVRIEPFSGYKVDKSLISVREDFDIIIPSYQDMLLEQLDWIQKNSSLYPHYVI